MKLTCARCGRHARKWYRTMSTCDDGELICRDCLLKYAKADCDNCDKAAQLYAMGDCGGDTAYVCKSCYLSGCQAEPDEVDDYRELLEEKVKT